MMVSYRTYGVLICCPYLFLIIAFHSYIQIYEKVPSTPYSKNSPPVKLTQTEYSKIMASGDLSTLQSQAFRNSSYKSTIRGHKQAKLRLPIRQSDNKAKPPSEINRDTWGLVAGSNNHKNNETLNSAIHNAKPDRTLNSASVWRDKREPAHTSRQGSQLPPVNSLANDTGTRQPIHQAKDIRLSDNMSNKPHDELSDNQPQSNDVQMTGTMTGERQSALLRAKQDNTSRDISRRAGNEQGDVHIDSNHRSPLPSSSSVPQAQGVPLTAVRNKANANHQDKSITHPSLLHQTATHSKTMPTKTGLKMRLSDKNVSDESSKQIHVIPTGLPLQPHCISTYATHPSKSNAQAHANIDAQNASHALQKDFQEIHGTYLYSAYLDARVNPVQPVIKIMALVKRGTKPALFCHFVSQTMSGESIETVPVEHREMCENHAKEYGGWFLNCNLPLSMVSNPPCNVLVSAHRYYHQAHEDGIQLPILRLKTVPHERKHDFTVCIPPLFGHIPSTTLIEFIELTRLLGASHFTFYSLEISREVRRVLEYYSGMGLAEVLPWRVPLGDKAVWYHAQLLSINDCLYRSVHRARRTAFHDLDEFIVPHLYANWSHLVHGLHDNPDHSYIHTSNASLAYDLKHNIGDNDAQAVSKLSVLNNEQELIAPPLKHELNDTDYDVMQLSFNTSQLLRRIHGNSHMEYSQWAVNESQYCGYSFHSAFFDPLNNGNPRVLYDLESDLRTKIFSKVRAKVMVMAERIEELGIHHISKPIHDWLKIYHVTPEYAYIHHYRQCMTDFDPKMKCHIFMRDESMFRYIPYLRHNVHDVTWLLKEADRRGITDYRSLLKLGIKSIRDLL